MHGDFALVLRNMAATGARVQAILMDLGVSSMQIDRPDRGFSYASDAPLDMRMDAGAELTAAEIVNTWDERDLAGVLRTFGEERYAVPDRPRDRPPPRGRRRSGAAATWSR